jgi:multidrug resistance efflux pump
MRFRRTVIVSKSAATKPKPATQGARAASRRSGRKLYLFGFGMLIVAAGVVNHAWIRADGIVAGDLTSVSPIVQARLKELLVHCLDHVKQGQRVAEFSNEATAEAAEQQLQQLILQLQQAESQTKVADAQAAAAQKLVEAQEATVAQLAKVSQAYDVLVKSDSVAALAGENAKAALARAKSEEAAAEFVYQTQVEQRAKAESDAEILRQRIASFKNAPELTGDFSLMAPNDGIVTDCTAHVGEVVPAHSPMFHIFDPEQAYAIVFFDPGDRARIAVGERFDVRVSGVAGQLAGRVAGFYPELSGMPTSLTRYFWQQERWSQYAPARVEIEELSAAERLRLSAWAQLSVSRWEWPQVTCAQCVQLFETTWQWIGHQAGRGAETAATTGSPRGAKSLNDPPGPYE